MFYSPAQARSMFLGRLAERLPPHVVAAIDMNARSESRYNSAAPGDNGNAFGLLQWNGPRREALIDFASRQGADPSDPIVQADNTIRELYGPERASLDAMLRTDDPGKAGAIFVRQFERPRADHRERRAAEYGGGTMPGMDDIWKWFNGQQQGPGVLGAFDIPPPTPRDRVVAGLQAASEAFGALGAGHAPNFAATNAFISGQQEQRMLRSMSGQGSDANATKDWITKQGYPELVDVVNSGGMTLAKAVEEVNMRSRKTQDAPTQAEIASAKATLTAAGHPELVSWIDAGGKPADALKRLAEISPVPGQSLTAPQVSYLGQLRGDIAQPMKDFNTVATAVQGIYEAAKQDSPGSDRALVTYYSKLLDPSTGVLGGEASAVEASGGVVRALITKAEAELTGGSRLSPQLKQSIVDMTDKLFAIRQQTAKKLRDQAYAAAGSMGIPKQQLLLNDGLFDTPLVKPQVMTAAAAPGKSPGDMADELGLQ